METAREQTYELEQKDLVEKIRKDTKGDMNNLIRNIIKEKIKQEKDPKKLYEFFNYVYDNLYHDIIFKKSKINKPIAKILEMLATPLHERTPEEQKSIIDTLLTKLEKGSRSSD